MYHDENVTRCSMIVYWCVFFRNYSHNFMPKKLIKVMNNCHDLLTNSHMYGIPHLLPTKLQKTLRKRNWYYHSIAILFFSLMLTLVCTMNKVAGIRLIASVFSLHAQILMLFRCCMSSHLFIMMYKTCNRIVRVHLEQRISLDSNLFLLESVAPILVR